MNCDYCGAPEGECVVGLCSMQRPAPYYIVTITISAAEDNDGWEGAARDLVSMTDTLHGEWAYAVKIGGV